ncbi:uncharacterized protein J3R85_012898 [Psidium guajava]|nr:uncharacterized protein J3R85_012898 [Psidium guajava]
MRPACSLDPVANTTGRRCIRPQPPSREALRVSITDTFALGGHPPLQLPLAPSRFILGIFVHGGQVPTLRRCRVARTKAGGGVCVCVDEASRGRQWQAAAAPGGGWGGGPTHGLAVLR